MGLRIDSNLSALAPQQRATRESAQQAASLNGLSTQAPRQTPALPGGGRLGALSERARVDVRQFTTDANRLQGGISIAQRAETSLAAQGQAVARIESLAREAAAETATSEQRAALDSALREQLREVDDLADGARFNGSSLLDGTLAGVQLTPGEDGRRLNLPESTAATLGLSELDLLTAEGAASAVDAASRASGAVEASQAGVAAQRNRFSTALAERQSAEPGGAGAIRDAESFRAAIDRTRRDVARQGEAVSAAQANVGASNALRLLA